jgi:Carbohydrate esterase, sialic acid-specific acetylesterase
MPRRPPVHHCLFISALLITASSAVARAQEVAAIKEPVASRVYQRDRNDRANIPIVLSSNAEASSTKIGQIHLFRASGTPAGPVGEVEGVRYDDGALVGVPTGGPYSILGTLVTDNRNTEFRISPIFVGDLWVLCGQSNMQGVGDLVDVTPPNDRVMLLGMDGRWVQAEEPLHWLVDSPDRVHSGDASTRAQRSDREHKTRLKGAGLGLPFAVAMVEATGVPVGLVACAHGGTSMAQWSPDKRDEAGESLYGSMMRQFALAGGKVKGVLWYQGESDANERASAIFEKVFTDFIAAVRSDFKQPDLPFYYVQIGRFTIRNIDPKPWNAVQDIQRRLVERIPNTAVVPVIDLPLDDAIHVGTQGLKRLGHRLARVALHELFGKPGGTTPTLDKVSRGPGNTIFVKFKGVNTGESGKYGLIPERHIGGFSLRKDDGTEIPLIYDVAVGAAKDTVVVKLDNKLPEGANLWYGWGYDPYCNLTDTTDMAVPVFGPIPLDEVK